MMKMFCFFASPIMIIEFHYKINSCNAISLLFYQSFDLFYGGNVSQGQLIELDPSMAKNLQTILVVFITLLLLFFFSPGFSRYLSYFCIIFFSALIR